MVCGDTSKKVPITVREMMFGTREEFEYCQCPACGCVFLITLPFDMTDYYPEGYYSFGLKCNKRNIPLNDNVVSVFLRRRRTSFLLYGCDSLGHVMARLYPPQPLLLEYLSWIRHCHLGFSSRILDVGCGNGQMIKELKWHGFSCLTGIDAFIHSDEAPLKGVKILKMGIAEMEGTFDCIMLHHSFEHMDDPAGVCRHIARLLAQDGWALIRMPTVSSYAWEKYRQHWAQLDAPRHICVQSLKSWRYLPNRQGL